MSAISVEATVSVIVSFLMLLLAPQTNSFLALDVSYSSEFNSLADEPAHKVLNIHRINDSMASHSHQDRVHESDASIDAFGKATAERSSKETFLPHDSVMDGVKAVNSLLSEEQTNATAWKLLSTFFTEMNDKNVNNYWLLIKPNIERISSYFEKEYPISEIKKTVPFLAFDKLLRFGDQVYLLNVLRGKLDDDFAEYIVQIIGKHLKPIGDLRDLYRKAMNGNISDLIQSVAVATLNDAFYKYSPAVYRSLASRDTFEMVPQFLDFIIPSSSLHEQLKNLLAVGIEQLKDNSFHHRVTRQISRNYDNYRHSNKKPLRRDYGHDDGYSHDDGYDHDKRSDYGHDSGYEHDNYGGHDSGYGSYGGGGHGSGYGGGYGYMQPTLDPYVVLGALGLGTLLAFVLYRIINGTGAAGREVPEHSFLLWLSDSPDVETVTNETTHSDSVLARSERDIFHRARDKQSWANKGLITGIQSIEKQLDDLEYPVEHLNGLWREYSATHDEKLVRRKFCEYLNTVATIDHLAGYKTADSLLMSCAASVLGVQRAGQLLDEATNNRFLQPGATSGSCRA